MKRAPQPDLFSAAPAPGPASAAARSGLTIAAAGGTALGPEQRKYNQLVQKLEKARADLQSWEEGTRHFAQEHARQMRPLMADLAAQRQRLVRKLADVLADVESGKLARLGKFSKRDRATLARSLCDEVASLIGSEFVDETAAKELEALHDRYAPTSLADERRAALDDVKGMIEAVTGLDMGDAEFADDAELMRHVQERMRAAAAQPSSDDDDDDDDPFAPSASAAGAASGGHHQGTASGQAAGNAARKAARQAEKKAARQAEEAAKATQSVREVFRRLASALHPDRAADEADRARRTALMQRVNQAYEQQDLLALFTLQLEIEQIDPEHLARAGTERIRHYNRVLATQLDDLQAEVHSREEAFVMQFGLEPWRKLNPRKLDVVLRQDVQDIRMALSQMAGDLRALDVPAGVKQFIQRERAQHQLDDEDPFGGTF